MATGLTIEQLAERQWKSARWIEAVLHDEARRGHVRLVGDRWQATPALVETYGSAFGNLTYLTGTDVQETRGERL